MKNLLKLTVLTLLFFLSFSACNKDEEEQINYNLEEEYFTMENASYMHEKFPETSSSGPVISNIAGNHSVLPGGSNAVEIQTNTQIKNVLVGVKDVNGFLRLPITPSEEFSFLILMNQSLTTENFELKIAVQDVNGKVSDITYIPVSLVQAGTGRLQVSCSWNQLNDVDLHLVEPNLDEIYYGDSYSTSGGELDVDSNPACSIDEINNENITYNDAAVIQNGEYIVRVDFFENCNITDVTNYNVIAYYEGELITPTEGTNPYTGSFNPDEADFGDAGDGVTVLKFVLPTSRDYGKSVLKFSYPRDKSKPKVLSPQKM